MAFQVVPLGLFPRLCVDYKHAIPTEFGAGTRNLQHSLTQANINEHHHSLAGHFQFCLAEKSPPNIVRHTTTSYHGLPSHGQQQANDIPQHQSY
jgi:hypothetical protein